MRLRFRRLFVPAAQSRLDNLARLDIRASEWTNHKWKTVYYEVYRFPKARFAGFLVELKIDLLESNTGIR